MNTNMSSADRIFRVLLVTVLAALYWFAIIPAFLGIALLVVGVIFLATSLIGFCPLYKLVGLSTKKNVNKV